MKHLLKAALSKQELQKIEEIEKEIEEDFIKKNKGRSYVPFNFYYEYGAKKLNLDIKIFEYMSNWFHNDENTLEKWNEVKNLKIPEEFKKPNKSIIYRGFYLSKKALKRFEQGKDIRLDPIWLSSWTEHKDVAKRFTYQHGVVIERPYSELDIWICLEKLYPYLDQDRNTCGMKEILVKGTGCTKNLLSPNLVIWSKFTEKGKAREMVKRETRKSL